MICVALVGVLGLGATAGDSESAPGDRIDRVIAVVDQDVITETELVLEARLALALRGAVDAASKKIEERFLTTFLDYLVNQLLISSQARRLGIVEVSDDELAEALDRFVDRFGSTAAFEDFLQRFGISEERLNASLLRDLRNGRYVTRRMKVRLMGRELEPTAKEYHDALDRWLEELRDSAEIRLLGPDGRLMLRASK